MLPSTLELLRDMLREAEFLDTEARRTTRDAFLSNEVLKRAFVRSIEIIGEVAKQVPEGTRREYLSWNGARWLACETDSSTITVVSTTSLSGT